MNNTIHMLEGVTGTQMNSFIITTADGKVIVIDGGYDQDAENTINYLKNVTGRDVPHVDAWILSHPHMDHISAFLQIMETMPEAVEVDQVWYNFPSLQFITQNQPWADPCLARFYKDLPRFADKILVVSKGDTLDVGDAHFECIYSPIPSFT